MGLPGREKKKEVLSSFTLDEPISWALALFCLCFSPSHQRSLIIKVLELHSSDTL